MAQPPRLPAASWPPQGRRLGSRDSKVHFRLPVSGLPSRLHVEEAQDQRMSFGVPSQSAPCPAPPRLLRRHKVGSSTLLHPSSSAEFRPCALLDGQGTQCLSRVMWRAPSPLLSWSASPWRPFNSSLSSSLSSRSDPLRFPRVVSSQLRAFYSISDSPEPVKTALQNGGSPCVDRGRESSICPEFGRGVSSLRLAVCGFCREKSLSLQRRTDLSRVLRLSSAPLSPSSALFLESLPLRLSTQSCDAVAVDVPPSVFPPLFSTCAGASSRLHRSGAHWVCSSCAASSFPLFALHLSLPRHLPYRSASAAATSHGIATGSDPLSSEALNEIRADRSLENFAFACHSFDVLASRLRKLGRWLLGSVLLWLPVGISVVVDAPLFVSCPEDVLPVRLALAPRELSADQEEREFSWKSQNEPSNPLGGRGEGVEPRGDRGHGGDAAASVMQREASSVMSVETGREGRCGGVVMPSADYAETQRKDGRQEKEGATTHREASGRDSQPSAEAPARGASPDVKKEERSGAHDEHREESDGGALLLASPWAMQAFSRGDVVYYQHPMDSGRKLFLRVVAVANDVIRVPASLVVSIHPTLRKQLLMFGEPRVVGASGLPLSFFQSASVLLQLVDNCNQETMTAAHRGADGSVGRPQRVAVTQEGIVDYAEDERLDYGPGVFIELTIPVGSCWLEAERVEHPGPEASKGGCGGRGLDCSQERQGKRDNDISPATETGGFAPGQGALFFSAGSPSVKPNAGMPPIFEDSYTFGLAPISLIQGVVYAVLPHTHSASEARLLLCRAFLASLGAEVRESRLLCTCLAVGDRVKNFLVELKGCLLDGGVRLVGEEPREARRETEWRRPHLETRGRWSVEDRERGEGASPGRAGERHMCSSRSRREADAHACDISAGGRRARDASCNLPRTEHGGDDDSESSASAGSSHPGIVRCDSIPARTAAPVCQRATQDYIDNSRIVKERRTKEETHGVAAADETRAEALRKQDATDFYYDSSRGNKGSDNAESLTARLVVLVEQDATGGDRVQRTAGDRHDVPCADEIAMERPQEQREGDAPEANARSGHRGRSEAESQPRGGVPSEVIVPDEALLYRLINRATQWLVLHADIRGIALPLEHRVTPKGTIVVGCGGQGTSER
ncbi:hypothetical protein BESB_058890 [Besnoitia besnoiti]|uniref:Uncharacterized protein n=1 Tax=Besnoitia besnoiti TaxID=94643 RepID=A0A2A9MHY1_BESBE|nr:hypothetical protein BESB_058890 [Besnoitia besnoiti]PFH35002.1 hypothetical protein BESB_058890 [Besnoitia besnoiti]